MKYRLKTELGDISDKQLNALPKTSNETALLVQKIYGDASSNPARGKLNDVQYVAAKDHSILNKLDFENSGHTGFLGYLKNTTAYWEGQPEFVPALGQLIIYEDYSYYDNPSGGTVYIAAYKLGDGVSYISSLPFLQGDLTWKILEHFANGDIHITTIEREFWNNKLNYESATLDDDGVLVFTRD